MHKHRTINIGMTIGLLWGDIMLEIIQNKLPIAVSEEYSIDNITNDFIEDLFNIYSNEKVAKYIARKTHKSIKDTKEFIELIKERMEENNNIYLGIYTVIPKKLVGVIRLLNKEEPEVLTIGYGLSVEYWGRGIMPSAVDSLIPFIKEDGTYSVLRATIREENINSQKSIKKMGFQLSGKLKKTEIVHGKEVESERLLYYKEL